MFGTSKNLTSFRIDEGDYIQNINFKGRYEPKKFDSFKEQETKENHITYRLFCKTVDLRVKDKIVDGQKSFIIGGVYEFNDTFGPHQESLMRLQNSHLHEIVQIKSLTEIQNNFDELLSEWSGDKDYDMKTVSVLMDSAKLMKGDFIKMLSGGKVENTEWIMTLDYPEKLAKEDKIVYNGDEFEVQWIVPFPDKILVGLYKDIKNYE